VLMLQSHEVLNVNRSDVSDNSAGFVVHTQQRTSQGQPVLGSLRVGAVIVASGGYGAAVPSWIEGPQWDTTRVLAQGNDGLNLRISKSLNVATTALDQAWFVETIGTEPAWFLWWNGSTVVDNLGNLIPGYNERDSYDARCRARITANQTAPATLLVDSTAHLNQPHTMMINSRIYEDRTTCTASQTRWYDFPTVCTDESTAWSCEKRIEPNKAVKSVHLHLTAIDSNGGPRVDVNNQLEQTECVYAVGNAAPPMLGHAYIAPGSTLGNAMVSAYVAAADLATRQCTKPTGALETSYVVFFTLGLSGVTSDEFTNEKLQYAFQHAVAVDLNVTAKNIIIVRYAAINDAGQTRRLLGTGDLAVEVAVTASSSSTATSVNASVSTLGENGVAFQDSFAEQAAIVGVAVQPTTQLLSIPSVVTTQDPSSVSATPVLDTTSPVIETYFPLHGATKVSLSTNIVFTFNEDVQVGAGNITLTPVSGSAVIINVSNSSSVVVEERTVTIIPGTLDPSGMEYSVTVSEGAFSDGSNQFSGLPTEIYNFSLVDKVAPNVIGYLPSLGATNQVNPVTLTLTFNEAVQPGIGEIVLSPSGGTGTNTEVRFDVTSGYVSFSGPFVVINQGGQLVDNAGKLYTVTMAPGVIRDISGNDYVGITGNAYQFGVSDTTPPFILHYSPAQDGTAPMNLASIILTLNEPVNVLGGSIIVSTEIVRSPWTVIDDSNYTHLLNISTQSVMTSDQVMQIDTNFMFEEGTTVTVEIDSGAFQDSTGHRSPNFLYQFSVWKRDYAYSTVWEAPMLCDDAGGCEVDKYNYDYYHEERCEERQAESTVEPRAAVITQQVILLSNRICIKQAGSSILPTLKELAISFGSGMEMRPFISPATEMLYHKHCQAALVLKVGQRYVFNVSHVSMNADRFVLSETSDGPHNGGSVYHHKAIRFFGPDADSYKYRVPLPAEVTWTSYNTLFTGHNTEAQTRELHFTPFAVGNLYFLSLDQQKVGGEIHIVH